ncbi:uncharacterized protein LACBIDRAFT_296497 [Laccaria bicolor S238N-H82]|uniref:Predicted protein n=1 Tax=Laccaria bicolor (strain S238N-H82 / ATCC MYA-4686) TaxID=486041 RepID=B0D8Y9_LACBS|nr:uncharacterized protein LACBIDRAFT_296497 [Laccaria bicolor S238N-H82]EDR09159.1 predicted protein [Laccaria bicolor S238N-H82]|eukprot:XP_001880472.1 predicted protein [Laccaria bicolor S238N-H82]
MHSTNKLHKTVYKTVNFPWRGVNRNRNRSAFSPEVKRPDRTAKRPQTAVFCGL